MNEMKKQLRFNANGKIRIMLFGDLHENSDDTSPEGKAKFEDMQLLMKTAAARLKPDLAVFMGDVFSDTENAPETLNRIVKPLTDAGIPFAAVKVLKRNAYGYRNFTRFRKRILNMFS